MSLWYAIVVVNFKDDGEIYVGKHGEIFKDHKDFYIIYQNTHQQPISWPLLTKVHFSPEKGFSINHHPLVLNAVGLFQNISH